MSGYGEDFFSAADQNLSVLEEFYSVLRSIEVLDTLTRFFAELQLDKAAVTVAAVALDTYEISMLFAQYNLNSFVGSGCLCDSALFAIYENLNRTLSAGPAGEKYLVSCRKGNVSRNV